MYYFDNQRHHKPHVHVRYQGEEAVFEIPSGEILEGMIQKNRIRLVQAWIEIHQEELMADWELAIGGEEVFRIDPLK